MPYRNFNQLLVFIIGLVFSIIALWLVNFDAKFTVDKLLLIFFPVTVASGFSTLTKPIVSKAKDFIQRYGKRQSFQLHLGIQHEIQKELVLLFKAWPTLKHEGKKILIFVDDIDRCSENKIIEIVDAIRVMLHDEEIYRRLCVIVAVDDNTLRSAIKRKYESLVKEEEVRESRVREYMDKLFIARIKLSPLDSAEQEVVLNGFTDNILEPETKLGADITESHASGTPDSINITRNKKRVEEQNEGINIKEGRIGLTSLDGNPQPPIDASYSLTQKEKDLPGQNLKGLNEPTPRSIRLFVYRYILAKNILESVLLNKSEMQEWAGDSNSVLRIILADSLQNYMNGILKEDYDKVDLSILQKVLKAVNMVVPYSPQRK